MQSAPRRRPRRAASDVRVHRGRGPERGEDVDAGFLANASTRRELLRLQPGGFHRARVRLWVQDAPSEFVASRCSGGAARGARRRGEDRTRRGTRARARRRAFRTRNARATRRHPTRPSGFGSLLRNGILAPFKLFRVRLVASPKEPRRVFRSLSEARSARLHSHALASALLRSRCASLASPLSLATSSRSSASSASFLSICSRALEDASSAARLASASRRLRTRSPASLAAWSESELGSD